MTCEQPHLRALAAFYTKKAGRWGVCAPAPTLTTTAVSERSMAKKPLPSPDVLRQLLDYDPATGKLYWLARTPDLFTQGKKNSPESKCNRWNALYAGREALTANSEGYRFGYVMGVGVGAHRVVWAWWHGEWPNHVDHINGERDDNRIVNLRSVTQGENNRNQKFHRTNTSGVMGVSWMPKERKWQSYISVKGIHRSLGWFACFGKAIAARKAAEVQHGFHPNHGRRVA